MPNSARRPAERRQRRSARSFQQGGGQRRPANQVQCAVWRGKLAQATSRLNVPLSLSETSSSLSRNLATSLGYVLGANILDPHEVDEEGRKEKEWGRRETWPDPTELATGRIREPGSRDH